MKKFLTYSVVIATIAWSMGLGALVPAASAATPVDGDVVKVAGNATVYYISGGKKYNFTNRGTYSSWASTIGDAADKFATLKVISQADLDAVSSWGGNVTVRSGNLVKFNDGATLYAVGAGAKLYAISDAAAKTALFGSTAQITLAGAARASYFDNGNSVASLTATSQYPAGTLVKASGSSDVYYWDGSARKLVTTDAFTANGFKSSLVRTVSDVTAYGTLGSSVAAKDASISAPVAGTVAPVSNGALTVSLSANNPVAGNVVKDIDNVVFAKLNLAASSAGSVQVNSVKVGRQGLGSTGDFASVSLYDGATKLGSTRTSWDSNNKIVFNIPNGWVIPAGTSKELTIVANVDAPSTYNALGVDEIGVAAGSVAGLPVYGNQMTAVTIANLGGVSITNNGSAVTKRIGTTDVTMAQFNLLMNANEDGSFQRITLKNKAATSNASDGDVANLYLYKGATKLAGPVQMVSDKITFVLSAPVSILKSQSEDFKVVGDVVNGAANTVEFVLDATTDLTVKGAIYGTDLPVTSGTFNEAGEGDILTISGSELNIAYTGTAVDTMADVTGINFGTVTFSAGATDVKITNMILTVDETEGNATAGDTKDVDNFQLVAADGSAYSGVMTNGGDTDADDETWTFTDEIYLVKGTSKAFTIKGDLPSGIGDGDAYKVTMTVNTTNLSAETVPAGDAISAFSIGSIAGKLVTVKSPYLTIKAVDQNAGNATVNQQNVELFKGTFEATAGTINLSRVKFISTAADYLYKSNWSEVGLYTVNAAGAYTLLQNITNSNMTTDVLDYDSFNLSIPAGSANAVTFVVKGTVAGTVSSATTTQAVKLDMATAKDTKNNAATVKNSAGSTVTTGSNPITTTRTITLGGTGSLNVAMRNADTGVNKDRVLLAGTNDWIGLIRLKANFSDIKIKDLKLTNANATSDDSVSSVCLYKAMAVSSANLVGCTTLNGATAFFQSLNATVPQGSQDWYIYVSTNPMSDAPNGTADTKDAIAFSISTSSATNLTAEDANGNALAFSTSLDSATAAGEITFDLDLDGTFDEAADETGTASTKTFTVAGSKIAGVSFVSSYSGVNVASSLNTTGSTTIAILKIDTSANSNKDASGNALKAVLENIVLDVSKHSTTTISAAGIQRIGGNDTYMALTISAVDAVTETAGDWTLSNASSTWGTDGQIEQGSSAYYKVVANISALDAQDIGVAKDWIQVDLDSLNSGTNNIDWFDGYSTAAANRFDYLRTDATSVAGTKIIEQ